MCTLDVLYTCDDNYAAWAGISMLSLFENNKELDRIRVYIAAYRVSEENKKRLSDIADDFGRQLIIVDGEELSGKIKSAGIPEYRGSIAASFRLFFDIFILPDTKRLLYLDCDTLVVGDLAQICDLDLGGKVCGAVRDSLTPSYKAVIGMAPDSDYFNSGVLLIDTEAWKREKITEKLLDHAKNKRSDYCNPDQDLLNKVLEGKTLMLPPEYNLQPVHRAFSYSAYMSAFKPAVYYSKEELSVGTGSPRILHTYRFLGDFPWHARDLHPDTKVFDRYLGRSPWKDYKKLPSEQGLIFKIEKLLYKTLPPELFLRIFAIATEKSFKKADRKRRGRQGIKK